MLREDGNLFLKWIRLSVVWPPTTLVIHAHLLYCHHDVQCCLTKWISTCSSLQVGSLVSSHCLVCLFRCVHRAVSMWIIILRPSVCFNGAQVISSLLLLNDKPLLCVHSFFIPSFLRKITLGQTNSCHRVWTHYVNGGVNNQQDHIHHY